MRKVSLALAFIVGALAVVAPLAVSRQTQDLDLNQFLLQTQSIRTGDWGSRLLFDYVRSSYALGLERIVGPLHPLPNTFRWEDPKSVFEFVFFRAPAYAVVYPTETYYYFAFDSGGSAIAGNFRFVDAQEGKLHIGYFNRRDPHSDLMGSATFDERDGVSVTLRNPHEVAVSYQNVTKVFMLNSTAATPPRRLRLLPEERFVSRVLDESGFGFFLLFNEGTDSFYFVSNDELSFPDEQVPGPGNYVLSPRTSFVFYKDIEYDRILLVGVHEKSVFMNSYFDGPFDQVPPRLPLREMLHEAYPYTKERGGIDEHGNFLTIPDTRVAISPYTTYRKLSELVEYQSRCKSRPAKSEHWSCLTYEWKRDFHRFSTAPASESNYESPDETSIFVRQGWPANHYRDASFAWPHDHLRLKSSEWPANYTDDVDRK